MVIDSFTKEISILLSPENYKKLSSSFSWRSYYTQIYHYYDNNNSENKNTMYIYILEKCGRYTLTICKIENKDNKTENHLYKKDVDSVKDCITKEELFEITGEKYDHDYNLKDKLCTRRIISTHNKETYVFLDSNSYFRHTDYELVIDYKKELPIDLINKLSSLSISISNDNPGKYYRFVKQMTNTTDKAFKLPMIVPPYTTYQGMAFMLGIILSHYNTKNYIYNNFITISCKDTDKIWELSLELVDILWDSLSGEGIFEQDFYEIKKYLNKKTIIPFFKERLEQSSYILLYTVDEFYLSYSESYKKEHFIHDLYLYGYDNDKFCVMAYKNEKLQLFNVPQNEIQASIWALNNPSFCTCRPNKIINVEINYEKMKENIIDYYNGKKEDNYLYGIKIYDAIINSLLNFIKNKEQKIDMRVFRMIWEHKKILKLQLLKLQEVLDIETYVEDADKIEVMGNKVFLLGIKFRLTKDFSNLKKMVEILNSMKTQEQKYLKKLKFII